MPGGLVVIRGLRLNVYARVLSGMLGGAIGLLFALWIGRGGGAIDAWLLP